MTTTCRRRGFVAGAGYIGGALARHLLADGWEIVALTRNPETAAGLEADGVGVVVSELEADTWHRAVTGEFDAVWNTVGSGGGGLSGFERSYIGGNRSIARWLQTGKGTTRFYVFTGSVSVYPQTGGEWVDEDSPVDGCGPGGERLLEAESVVRDVIPDSVVRGTCRLAGIYGPGRHLLLSRLIDGAATIPGSPEVWLNLIHQEDAVRVLTELARVEQGRTFTYNLSDGNPGTRGAIVSWLGQVLNQPVPPFDPTRSARPTAARTGAGGEVPNRRIDSRRIWEVTGIEPSYPSYQDGYFKIIGDRVRSAGLGGGGDAG